MEDDKRFLTPSPIHSIYSHLLLHFPYSSPSQNKGKLKKKFFFRDLELKENLGFIIFFFALFSHAPFRGVFAHPQQMEKSSASGEAKSEVVEARRVRYSFPGSEQRGVVRDGVFRYKREFEALKGVAQRSFRKY